MKKITLICNHCEKEIPKSSHYIEMGSSSGNSFFYKNHDDTHRIGKMISMSNQDTLHFCGHECFTNHFFGRELKES